MRWSTIGVCAWALSAQAQTEWSYQEAFPGSNAWTRDIIELPDGYLLATTVRDGPPGSADVVIHRLTSTGSLVSQTSPQLNGSLPNVCCLTSSTDFEDFSAYGVLLQQDGIPAFFKHVFNSGLVTTVGMVYPVPERQRLFMENVVLGDSGKVLLMAGGIPGTTAYMEGEIVQLDQDGIQLGGLTLLSQNGLDVIPLHGLHDATRGTVVAVLGSVLGSGFYRSSHFLWIDHSLEVPQYFFAPERVTGGPLPTGTVMRITDSPCMVPLPSGNFVVSATHGSLTQGTGGLLLRMTDNGDTLSHFLPPDPFHLDHTAALEALAMDENGNLLYCQMENLQIALNSQGEVSPLEPVQPSRIRILKLDTAFNLLCEQVIDGFEENAYYLPTRIRPTSDGGYVVIGSRRQLNTVDGAMMWAAKFGPEACVNNIAEASAPVRHRVFPNPGVEGFNILLSGPPLSGASVQLFDALGRRVASSAVHENKAWLSATHLGSGAYVYQVIDRNGIPVAQGGWVRE